MLSRVKQGISGRPKIPLSIRPIESDTSLVRRLSGRRKRDEDTERRSQSFEVARQSIESGINEAPESVSFSDASIERSFTDSTVSTAEVLGDSPGPATPKAELVTSDYCSAPETVPTSSPTSHSPESVSPQPTPRPPNRKEPPRTSLPLPGLELSLTVPCVDLYVVMDAASVDVHSRRDVWVAIEATVRSMTSKVLLWDVANSPMHFPDGGGESEALQRSEQISGSPLTDYAALKASSGAITTLRLCFKPVQGCQLREVIGQKSLKDLVVGQQCSLFVKVRVPKIRVRDSTIDPDQDSLFMELESIIGTLKTEILHVEARYRHSMLPLNNVVTVRHVCKIKRPKTESRWSIAGNGNDLGAPAEVHTMLARYVAAHYAADKAVELLDRYLGPMAIEQPAVRDIYESLANDAQELQAYTHNNSKPSVVVTDIDLNTADSMEPGLERFSTAPNTPTTVDGRYSQQFDLTNIKDGTELRMKSQTTLLNLAPPLLTAPKTTIALSRDISSSTTTEVVETQDNPESHDAARQLWRHIRRTSLSAKQLQELTPERLSHLEAGDEHLKELRQRALANKRSIGAETLRAWKWEESMQLESRGEAPWM